MKRWRHRLLTPAAAGVLLCTVLLLGGCATPQVSQLAGRWPPQLPAAAQVRDVPFFAQEDYQCGPAALAMVATAAGVPLDPAGLVEQVYVPARQGSLQVEMLATTRRNGLVAYPLAPRLEALLQEVAAGNPVLVLQNLAFPVSPVWHYAVVIGYDRGRNVLVLHSGRTERMEMSLYTFERTWERSGYWAMLALPPKRLPATVEADAWTAAAAALERARPDAAQTAYATALAAWPNQRAALLGAGNTAYTLGQRERAAAAFEAATVAHPDFADGWNNLAQVRLELGQRSAALDAIRRAVALGGPRQARYQALQQKIESD